MIKKLSNKELSNKELTEHLKELTEYLKELSKSQVKEVDLLKKFVIQNTESHENHTKNTISLIDYNKTNNYIIKKLINYISLIFYVLNMIILYLLYPSISKILVLTSKWWSNFTEWWQIAIFTIIWTLIAWTIATVLWMIIYEKIKSK